MNPKRSAKSRFPALILVLLLLLTSLTSCQLIPGIGTTPKTTALTSLETTVPSPVETTVSTTQAEESPDGEVEIHFLDVGQGDSTLIRTADAVILVDTGDIKKSVTQSIITYLQDLNIEKIDYLFLTHPDADHIGGAPDIIRAFTVTHCLMPDVAKSTQIFTNTVAALEERDVDVIQGKAGMTLTAGSLRMELLAPNSEKYSNTNNYSIVFRLVFGENRVLMTGDAETISENEMLAACSPAALRADILKVGHHGSDTSTGQTFLSRVHPDYAVISVGAGNKYGHPCAETLASLQKAEVEILRTDLSGTIVFRGDGKNFTLVSPKK